MKILKTNNVINKKSQSNNPMQTKSEPSFKANVIVDQSVELLGPRVLEEINCLRSFLTNLGDDTFTILFAKDPDFESLGIRLEKKLPFKMKNRETFWDKKFPKVEHAAYAFKMIISGRWGVNAKSIKPEIQSLMERPLIKRVQKREAEFLAKQKSAIA